MPDHSTPGGGSDPAEPSGSVDPVEVSGLLEESDPTGSTEAPEADLSASGSRRILLVVASLAAAFVAVIAVVVGIVATRDDGGANDAQGSPAAGLEVVDEKGPVTHSFVVPAGTAMRIEQGLHVNVVPDRLEVRVGDTIRIRNEDNVAAEVGIFNVAPGVTVTMRFTEAGRLAGYCSVDPSGQFVIEVQE